MFAIEVKGKTSADEERKLVEAYENAQVQASSATAFSDAFAFAVSGYPWSGNACSVIADVLSRK
jgi:hypothetical protein